MKTLFTDHKRLASDDNYKLIIQLRKGVSKYNCFFRIADYIVELSLYDVHYYDLVSPKIVEYHVIQADVTDAEAIRHTIDLFDATLNELNDHPEKIKDIMEGKDEKESN